MNRNLPWEVKQGLMVKQSLKQKERLTDSTCILSKMNHWQQKAHVATFHSEITQRLTYGPRDMNNTQLTQMSLEAHRYVKTDCWQQVYVKLFSFFY